MTFSKLKIGFLSLCMLIVFGAMGTALTGCGDDEPTGYAFTFETGSMTPLEPKDIAVDETLPEPEKTGHRFLGWYMNDGLTTPFSWDKVDTDAVTVYAAWEPLSYVLTLMIEGAQETVALDYGASLSDALHDPTLKGHTFIGWYEDAAFNTALSRETMPARDVSLYAQFETNTYTITFDNTVTPLEPKTYAFETPIDLPSAEAVEGYHFVGWFMDEAFETPFIYDLMPNYDITIYAQFHPNPHDLTLYVPTRAQLVDIVSGDAHGAALDESGNVFTWGTHEDGRLGDGTQSQRALPASIMDGFSLEADEKIVLLSAGSLHTFALSNHGRLFAWGFNGLGRLGDGTTTSRGLPFDITSQFDLAEHEGIAHIYAGAVHNVAVTTENRVFTWGYNQDGQLGDGTRDMRLSPVEITDAFHFRDGETVRSVALGTAHTLLATSTGRIFAWGSNADGQLGFPTAPERLTPYAITDRFIIPDPDSVYRVAASASHSFLLSEQGRLFAWGNNDVHQIALETTNSTPTPTRIDSSFSLDSDERIKHISAAPTHGLLITNTGNVASWGLNQHAQRGDDGPSGPTPRMVVLEAFYEETALQILASRRHSFILTDDGDYFAFGLNTDHVLGVNGANTSYSPVRAQAWHWTRVFEDTVLYDTPIDDLFTPKKTGHTVAGWYHEPSWDTAMPSLTMPDASLTLYAQFERAFITVDFDPQGGTDVAPLEALYRARIDAPEAPERAGYLFGGWTLDGEPFTFTTMPPDDLTLKAHWEAQSFTITFNSGEGTFIEPITQAVDTELILETPEKTGHTFIGWVNEDDEPFARTTMPPEDTVLYANWQRNDYTITVETLGGDTIAPINAPYESGLETPAAPTRDGYVFAGFYADLAYTTPYTFDTMPAEDITVYVKWDNTLSFETYGGTTVDAVTKHTGEPIIQPDDPEKLGHTFGGWYTDETFSTPFIFDEMPEPNTTLYAKWQINSYTFTFDSAGGDAVNPIEKPFDEPIHAPNATREGYTFIGWFDGDDPYKFNTVPAHDVHLRAKWHNTLTFESNGGSLLEPITSKAGSTITEPDAPEKLGHTFKGWYLDAAFTEPFVFESMPEPNTTLYARWDVNRYTITFETDGGSYVASITDDYDAPLTLPEDPEKTGHTFSGWTMDEAGETPFVLTNMPAENITLHAAWSRNTYTITFESNQGEPLDAMHIDYDAPLNIPNGVREGYVFMGWYHEPSFETLFTKTTMPADDITLHAQWYNMIAFETYGGTAIEPIIQPFGTPVNAPSNPTKTGHSFAGWFEDEAFTTPYVFDLMERPNKTLHAQWVVNDYTITFKALGGTEVDAMTLPFGTTISAPETAREGDTFIGWYTAKNDAFPIEYDTLFTFDTMPAKNVTLYAKWHNTLTFDTQGGSAINPITQAAGSTIKAPDQPQKEGHTFSGWYKDSTHDEPFGFDVMPETNKTIYAKWSINTYTITFDSAGGSAVDVITQDFGTTIEAPKAPEKEGHTFMAWLYEGELYSFDAMPANDITLTAEWSINQYTISFDSDGGSPIEPITKDFNAPIAAPDNPSKEGHTLIGWTYNGESYSFDTMPSSDITLKAQWEVNRYTITFETYSDEIIEPITQPFGSDIHLPIIEKAGYHFGGWYASDAFETLITLDTMPASDITLHAAWQRTITFDSDEGSPVAPLLERPYQPITAPSEPYKEGHTFSGWLYEGTPFTFGDMPDENITLTAAWDINDYTITFDTQGGTHSEPLVVTYDEPINLPDNPTRDDHDFTGWFIDDALTVPFAYDTMPSQNITVFAAWEPHDFTITYYDETLLQFDHIASNGYSGVEGFNVGLTPEGRVFTWGANAHGQLGNGTTEDAHAPQEITAQFALNDNETITSVYTGYGHAFAYTSENRVFAWGRNRYGQVGNGTTTNQSTPVEITNSLNLQNNETVIAIDASNHTMALTSEGRLLMWGYNYFGQLGMDSSITNANPLDITSAFSLQGNDKITAIAAGSSHSLVVTTEGRVFAFGNNANGQLGNNSTTSSETPIEITNHFTLEPNDTIIAVYGGRIRSVALSENGQVFSFGRNEDGVLGDGTTTQRTTPTNITNHFALDPTETITALFVGSMHTFAITDQDRVFGWGHNDYGQLMNNSTDTLNTPTHIALDPSLNLTSISAAHEHTTLLDDEGLPYASGNNTSGELGTGDAANHLAPTPIETMIWRRIHTESRPYTSTLEPLFEPIPREGYTFNQWFTDQALTQPFTVETMPNYPLVLYASWERTNHD